MELSNEELENEQKYLEETTKTIDQYISLLGQELYDDEEKQREFKEYMWNKRTEIDFAEMKTLLGANDLQINDIERKAKYYKKLYKIQNNPYFGRIVFKDSEEEQNIYIGLTYLTKENNNLIYDWRAPISSLFYDCECGKASYVAPEGIIDGIIEKKRQYTIENRKFKRIFDNNLNINDELLQEVLSNKASDKMKNIVNTIQKEQNLIIRNTEDKVLIVQGIAGSGKTSVALHRIAFLLYKIKNLTSDKVLIFSPNNVFSKYISNVLPELGEENTKETTFEKFLYSYIKEYENIESFTEFIERYYNGEENEVELIKFKQSDSIIKVIEKYIKQYTITLYFDKDILNHDLFISQDTLNELYCTRYQKLSLYKRLEAIAEKITLNNFKGNKSKKRSVFKWLYTALNKSIVIKDIYKSFYKSNIFKEYYSKNISDEYLKKLDGKTINYEDAILFVYFKHLLTEFHQDFYIEQVVIDEAQDYSILQYILLKRVLRKATFTILGDINQTINPYYKYDSLESLDRVFDNINYLELSKTYRSSPEIIEYTNKILCLNHVSAIRKETSIPVISKKEKNIKNDLISDIKMLEQNNSSIAIITKTTSEANKIYDILKKEFEDLTLMKNSGKSFSRKLVVLPSYLAKGLEFDATIVYTNVNDVYTSSEKYLYYVSCTRTQHHLIIYNQKEFL